MPSCGMLRRVALVRTDVSEELSVAKTVDTDVARADELVHLKEWRLLGCYAVWLL
jgi:hypothetical protein